MRRRKKSGGVPGESTSISATYACIAALTDAFACTLRLCLTRRVHFDPPIARNRLGTRLQSEATVWRAPR